jgi:hypothetical protein
MTDNSFPCLVTSSEGDEMLRRCKGFLAKDRCGPRQIPFVKFGRSVRYRKADLLAFIERSIQPAAE